MQLLKAAESWRWWCSLPHFVENRMLKGLFSEADGVQLWGEKLLAKSRGVVLSAAGGWHRRAGEKEFSTLQNGALQHPSPHPGLFSSAWLLALWWQSQVT